MHETAMQYMSQAVVVTYVNASLSCILMLDFLWFSICLTHARLGFSWRLYHADPDVVSTASYDTLRTILASA